MRTGTTKIARTLLGVSLVGMFAFVQSTAWANAQSMPSGQYLAVDTRHVWLYTNSTGTLIDNGPTLYSEDCDPELEVTQIAACGDCNYTPAGNNPLTGQPYWTNPETEYTYGRCAAVAVAAANQIATRFDVAVAHPQTPSYAYHGAVYKEWYSGGTLRQRIADTIYYPEATTGSLSCSNSADLSYCDSFMTPLNMLRGAPSEYDRYCGRLVMYATNPTPPTSPMVAVTARACAMR